MELLQVLSMMVIPCLTLISAGLFGRSGGVANLKTVPYIEGVTDVFLRSSYATGPDVATTLLDPSG
jgi:hypothetical protein